MNNSLTMLTASNINHELVAFATRKTCQVVPFDCIKIFSDKQIDIGVSYDYVKIPDTNDFNRISYNRLILKDLNDFIDTSHVLIYQYDGMAIRKNYWTNDYFNYDYIGAPTFFNTLKNQNIEDYIENHLKQNKNQEDTKKLITMGGGFSLRSKKLLEILKNDENIIDSLVYSSQNYMISEDHIICVIYKKYLEKKYGIKFAPLEVAFKFSNEFFSHGYSLGFHGWYNIPYNLSQKECIFYLEAYSSTKNLHDDLPQLHDLYYNARKVGYSDLWKIIEKKYF